MSEPEAGPDHISPDYISYGEFGEQFFAHAVTEERILAAIGSLAGQPIDVGPIGVGPGRLAKVTAKGAIGEATATPVAGSEVSFRVLLPVSLTFEVHLQVDTHRYAADLMVPLTLVARAAAPLRVVVDVVPPLPNQVTVSLKAEGLRASLLNKVIGIEAELQRFVAKYVKREVAKPNITKARVIDVAGAIGGAYASLSSGGSGSASSTITEDLGPALEREIEENPHLLEEFGE
jgi:hypothetical protein